MTRGAVARIFGGMALAAAPLALGGIAASPAGAGVSVVESFPVGQVTEWDVPDGVSCVTFTVQGASGGAGTLLDGSFADGAPGGKAAVVIASYEVDDAVDLTVIVGTAGVDGNDATNPGEGGFGGGGDGPAFNIPTEGNVGGGGGGGLSAVFVGDASLGSGASMLVVAGGGGGGGSDGTDSANPISGGAGGAAGATASDGLPGAPANNELPGLGGHSGDGDAFGGAGGNGTHDPGGDGEAGDDGGSMVGGDGGLIGQQFGGGGVIIGGGGGGGGVVGGGGGGGGGDQGVLAASGGGGAGSSGAGVGAFAPVSISTALAAGDGSVEAEYAPGDTSCVTGAKHATVLANDTWTAPAAACVTLTVRGASGGPGWSFEGLFDGDFDPMDGAPGGAGALVTALVGVPSGSVLDLTLGSPGASGHATASASSGGTVGGGDGAVAQDLVGFGSEWYFGGGGGGGASVVAVSGGENLVVAGGGGGGGAPGFTSDGNGDPVFLPGGVGGDAGASGGNGGDGTEANATNQPGLGGHGGAADALGGAGGVGDHDNGESGTNGAAGQGGDGGDAGDQFPFLLGGGGGGGGAIGGGGGGGGGDQGVLASSGGGGAGSSSVHVNARSSNIATASALGRGSISITYVPGDVSCFVDLTIVSGSNQEARVNAAYAAPLVVKVTDINGDPVAGHTVTFTAPASGPSGTFSDTGTNTDTAITDANGIATSSTFTANNQAGSVTVIASGSPTVTFALTNLAQLVALFAG